MEVSEIPTKRVLANKTYLYLSGRGPNTDPYPISDPIQYLTPRVVLRTPLLEGVSLRRTCTMARRRLWDHVQYCHPTNIPTRMGCYAKTYWYQYTANPYACHDGWDGGEW